MDLLLVAAGGALGAVCRYLAGSATGKLLGSVLPWGTFLINIAGCFCMGVLMTLIAGRGLLPAAWRLFVCVGVLGGFTTFSSFGYETVTLLQQGRLAAACAYACGSVVLGVLAAGIGVLLAR